jgi:hypothetical protein
MKEEYSFALTEESIKLLEMLREGEPNAKYIFLPPNRTANDFSTITRKMFEHVTGHEMLTSLLQEIRISYETDKGNLNLQKERKELARQMSHSVPSQQLYYIKDTSELQSAQPSNSKRKRGSDEEIKQFLEGVRVYKDNFEALRDWLKEQGNSLGQRLPSKLKEKAQIMKVTLINNGLDGEEIPVTLTMKKALDRLKNNSI